MCVKIKLANEAIVNQAIIYWTESFSFLSAAHEQTECREPAGDSGLSGHTEERFDKCCETGLSLSLGPECDPSSWGG